MDTGRHQHQHQQGTPVLGKVSSVDEQKNPTFTRRIRSFLERDLGPSIGFRIEAFGQIILGTYVISLARFVG